MDFASPGSFLGPNELLGGGPLFIIVGELGGFGVAGVDDEAVAKTKFLSGS